MAFSCNGQQKRQVTTTFQKKLNCNLSARIWRTPVFVGFGNRHRATPCNMAIGWALDGIGLLAMGLSRWLLVKAVVKPEDETMLS